jgi:2-phosphoglycerate kinase
MATAYLIGGTPRAGKTTLTMRFIAQQPMLAASTDAIRHTLRHIITPTDQPELFYLDKYISNDPEQYYFLQTHPTDVVVDQNAESAIVWRSVNDFIQSNIEDGFDILIEGVAVLPEYVSQLTCDYRVVFVGDKSNGHYETMLKSARANPNDWMHGLTDETIEAFATFTRSFSSFIEDEANKYGLPYVEVHDETFDTDMDTALKILRDN